MTFRYVKSTLLFLVTSFFIASCANQAKNTAFREALQPGDQLRTYLSSNSNDMNSTEELLHNYDGSKRLKIIISKYVEEIETLYSNKILDIDSSSSNTDIKSRMTAVGRAEAAALFALFPIDSSKWMQLVNTHTSLSKNDIYESAIAAGLDPSIVLNATAAGFTNTVTPLINSAGVVVYGQEETSTANVRFRAEGDSHWKKGNNLSWEPIYGAFAGSIVYLDADTKYYIEVQVIDEDHITQTYNFVTKTKPNTPPIDPDKVYYLSDIYTGGSLDLEALNIEGSENGYAKIIGDGQVIEVTDDALAGINIGAQSYIMLENITVTGGKRYGIFAKKAHHIWIKGCNISKFGRSAVDMRDGVAYSSTTSNSPINYDSGIYLERSGIAVIEDCEIHSPTLGANSWQVGHPKGANALQVWAYHDDEAYRGEFIVRNNRFYGAPDHRFNDVIEGRKNFERRGGFVKNSAIYGNYLAYANDDLIEIDGGQQNVLVYNNEMEQGYVGVSIAPNTLGPSYVFHNHIHNLGDETGKEWTAIKAGGLLSKPAGRTFVFENLIDVERNGIAASKVNNDTTFWVTSQNNIVFTKNTGYSVGYCIFDKEKYIGSSSSNDLCFNATTMDARYEFNTDSLLEHPYSNDIDYITSLKNNESATLSVSDEFVIPNFSKAVLLDEVESEESPSWMFTPNTATHSSISEQYEYGDTIITDSQTVTLTGNNWQVFPVNTVLSEASILELTLNIEGAPEIVGLGFDTDAAPDSSSVIRFSGSQRWGIDGEGFVDANTGFISFPIGQYITGQINYLIFALDNDDIAPDVNNDKAVFSSVTIR